MAKGDVYIDGTKIREFRDAKMWSQGRLAQRMDEIEGKHVKTRRKVISEKENAPISSAHYKTLWLFSEALEVPPQVLIARPQAVDERRSSAS